MKPIPGSPMKFSKHNWADWCLGAFKVLISYTCFEQLSISKKSVFMYVEFNDETEMPQLTKGQANAA